MLENGEYKVQICKDANTVILEKPCVISSGEELKSLPIIKELYGSNERLLSMTNEDFEKVIGRKIVLEPVKRPYDLNTPMRDYKTAGGKFLYGTISFVFKCILKSIMLGNYHHRSGCHLCICTWIGNIINIDNNQI